MTELLAVGQVCTAEGHAQYLDSLDRVCEIAWCPGINYARTQPVAGVSIGHDESWVVGTTVAYQRSQRTGLLAALTVRADHEDFLSKGGDWGLSPRLHKEAPNPMHWERAVINDLSIVRRPANVGTRPLRYAPLDSSLPPRGLPPGGEELWLKAKELASMARYRSAPTTLEITDLDELSIPELMATDKPAGRRALDAAVAARRERNAAQLVGVAETGRVHRRTASAPSSGSVRWNGEWLSPALSSKVLDMVDFDVPLDRVAAYVRAMRT
jgi:hypothetical protein